MPPSQKKGWVDWPKATARLIILQDLEPGGFLHNKDHIDARVIFDFYQAVCGEDFGHIIWDQFKVRLKDHRNQVELLRKLAERDTKAMKNNRRLYPRKNRNGKGELIFDMHPAKTLLRKDIKEGRHLKYKPSALRAKRKEYQEFDATIFKHRIYQEIRRQRWLNYLKTKRDEKKEAAKEAAAKEQFGPNKKCRRSRPHD